MLHVFKWHVRCVMCTYTEFPFRDIKPENLMLFKPRNVAQDGVNSGVDSLNIEEASESNNVNANFERQSTSLWAPAEHLTEKQAAEMDEAVWTDVPDGLRLKVRELLFMVC